MNYKHGMWGTPTHISWSHMIQRCENPNNKDYKDYGGRGIKVCKSWHNFRNFLADMGVRPNGLSLDRMNNDGNYEPGNCKWATKAEQTNNSRPNSCGRGQQRWFRAWHKDMACQFISNNQREFARQYGLNHGNISSCLHGRYKTQKGWIFQFLGGDKK